MSTRFTRRRFLQATAAAGLAAGAMPAAEKKKDPPRDSLRVAVIGLSNRGAANLRDVAGAVANVVALCDVDENRAAPARKEFPKASFDTDFRRVVGRKDVDAVLVATPDHTHAVITLAA